MAGSFHHIIKAKDLSFRGCQLLDNLGDASEALEECYDMLMYLTGGDRTKLYDAWKKGHMEKRFGKKHPVCTFAQYWKVDDA